MFDLGVLSVRNAATGTAAAGDSRFLELPRRTWAPALPHLKDAELRVRGVLTLVTEAKRRPRDPYASWNEAFYASPSADCGSCFPVAHLPLSECLLMSRGKGGRRIARSERDYRSCASVE